MKTRVQIVQELLDKRAISAEDAVVLLQPEIQYVYWNNAPVMPYSPSPNYPFWQVQSEWGNTTNNGDFTITTHSN